MSKQEVSEENIKCTLCDQYQPQLPIGSPVKVKGRKRNVAWITCDTCSEWYHPCCIGIIRKEYESLKGKKKAPFKCVLCCLKAVKGYSSEALERLCVSAKLQSAVPISSSTSPPTEAKLDNSLQVDKEDTTSLQVGSKGGRSTPRKSHTNNTGIADSEGVQDTEETSESLQVCIKQKVVEAQTSGEKTSCPPTVTKSDSSLQVNTENTFKSLQVSRKSFKSTPKKSHTYQTTISDSERVHQECKFSPLPSSAESISIVSTSHVTKDTNHITQTELETERREEVLNNET